MVKKIITGIIASAILGMLITSFFVSRETRLLSLFLSKITVTTLIAGICISIYASLSKSKLQIFLISILIGIAVFYLKYFVTGHHFDPFTMGAFVGAILGGVFTIIMKATRSFRVYKRLKKLRKRGFRNYSEPRY